MRVKDLKEYAESQIKYMEDVGVYIEFEKGQVAAFKEIISLIERKEEVK